MTRPEAVELARRMVVSEGATYASAAAASGIPKSTLEKMGAAEEWRDQRQSAATYGATVRACKVAMLQRVQELMADSEADLNQISQAIFAWKSAEAAWPEHRYGAQKDDPAVRLQVGAEMVTLMVEVLSEVDRNALTKLQPHLSEIGRRWEARCAA